MNRLNTRGWLRSMSGCQTTVIIGFVFSACVVSCFMLGLFGSLTVQRLNSNRQTAEISSWSATTWPLAQSSQPRIHATTTRLPPINAPEEKTTPAVDGGIHAEQQSPETEVDEPLTPAAQAVPNQGEKESEAPSTPASPTPTPLSTSLQQYGGLPANLPEQPATRLTIPALGVDTQVVLLNLHNGTWDISQLTHEVGHLQGTASPGSTSNVALAGHVTLAQGGSGPFKDLALVKVGDEAIVYQQDQSFRYVIDSINIVDPENVNVTFPTDGAVLTLITCANWDSTQQAYSDRIVAVGHLVQ